MALEAIKKLLEIELNLKAIVSSGFFETEDVKIAQRSCANKYIKKPYILEIVGLAVKEELGK